VGDPVEVVEAGSGLDERHQCQAGTGRRGQPAPIGLGDHEAVERQAGQRLEVGFTLLSPGRVDPHQLGP
jgi:hypothetical protein